MGSSHPEFRVTQKGFQRQQTTSGSPLALWLSGLHPGFVSALPAHATVARSLLTDLPSSWLRGNVFPDRVKIDPFPNMLIVAKKNK